MEKRAKLLTGLFVVLGSICFGVVVYFLTRIIIEGECEPDGGSTEPVPRPTCTISLNEDLNDLQPLVLYSYGDNAMFFFLPTNGDTVELWGNQSVNVACPGGNVMLAGSSTEAETGVAECVSDQTFVVRGQNYYFGHITCSLPPQHRAKYISPSCTPVSGEEMRIEFLVSGKSVEIIKLCFDTEVKRTVYTEFTLSKAIAGYQSIFPSPKFSGNDSYFHFPQTTIENLYTLQSQRATINKLLGYDDSSEKFIGNDGFYLSEGQLAAKYDFLYGSQQSTTFDYLNVAPQWEIFNQGNWNDLETDIRGYASRMGFDLTVYTGTYGVATLPHNNTGQDVELYLYVDGEKKQVPVPRLFWKIVYEQLSESAVVFIGVNNPHVFNPVLDVVCTDICGRYEWLSWKARNYTLGYSYCCEVEDFRRVVTDFPRLQVRNILP